MIGILLVATLGAAQPALPVTLDLAPAERAGHTVVVGPESGPAERLGAEELAAYAGRIARVRLQVLSSLRPEDVPERAIVLCIQGSALARSISPAPPQLAPEAYAILLRGQRLYLVGGSDRAVLYAAYDLLERLGCRWLAPALAFYEGQHEYVPEAATLTYMHERDRVEAPSLKFRKLYVEEGLSHDADNLRHIIAWMPKLRWNTLVIPTDYQGTGRVRWDNWREALAPELKRRGLTIEVGGHGYQNFLNAEMEQGGLFRGYAQWFGMDESARRTEARSRVFCTSNADALAFVEKQVLAHLERRLEIDIFDFWPPDGAKWCACEPCQALGPPSERHAMLVSHMARTLKDRGSKVRLECIAYSSYLDPPGRTPIHPDVLVDFCPIAQCFERQIDEDGAVANEKYRAALEAWRGAFHGDLSIYSYYRKYAWKSLPVLIPHYMQRDLQYYQRMGVKGVSTYAEPGDWFTYELNHYILGHLAWDPQVKVDGLIEQFCVARYGPAQRPAREIFEKLEATVRFACSLPGTSLKSPQEYNEKYLPAIVSCKQLLASAVTASGGDAHLTAHLRRLGLMLEYADRDMQLRRHQAAKGDEAQRREMVESLAAFLNEHASEGVFIARGEPSTLHKRYGLNP